MEQWIRSILEQFGAWAVGLLMLLENIFPPIPSEVVMPWAGYHASKGNTWLATMIVAGSVGSFLGAFLWYWAAKRIGKERLARWAARHGAWLGLSEKDVHRVDKWFDRWGKWAVLIGRLVPGLRTLISVPAGFSEMPVGQFSLYTAIGTVVWTTLLTSIGYFLGSQYEGLVKPLGWISTGVIVFLVIAWLWRVVRQLAARKNAAATM